MAKIIACALFEDLFGESEDESNEDPRPVNARAQARSLRDHSNPFEMPDEQFKLCFHLSKEAARYVVDTVHPHFPTCHRSNSITSMQSVLCSLNFFANGGYQKSVGGHGLFPMSQPSVSRALNRTTRAMLASLSHWVKLPSAAENKKHLKHGFAALGMPDVIGIVDGTHVAIVKPYQQEENYLNHKSYHSLNLQIVCDSVGTILNVDAEFPGSSDDSFVWMSSEVHQKLAKGWACSERDTYILGDSWYPLQPWLLTPFCTVEPGSPEERYQTRLVRVLCQAEQYIGMLKGRFRCLLKEKALHYPPPVAAEIVYCCAILHNISLHYNDSWDDVRLDEIDRQPTIPASHSTEMQKLGQTVRAAYVKNYFSY